MGQLGQRGEGLQAPREVVPGRPAHASAFSLPTLWLQPSPTGSSRKGLRTVYILVIFACV